MLSLLSSRIFAADAPASPRITYDDHCLTIDGKDTFIYSGAFHYFRCPKPLWRDRFQKMKDAGLNCVETYVAWDWNEPQPPSDPDDYSKLNLDDFKEWLHMAIHDYGFYVILRPGPYICAEWDGGGYPQWLITKKPKETKSNPWFRSDDPVYLTWCKHWFNAVAKVAAPEQITHQHAGQPGVILWQIENEYKYSHQPTEVKLHQLQALAHDSRDAGIDVPLITCQTKDAVFRDDAYLKANVIEASNFYPKYNMKAMISGLKELADYQPEKLKMITELQGGWFAKVGGKLSEEQGFDATQINQITLLAWERGVTMSNYYMMFGGTNFGDWAAATITTTYDYDAPIREPGGVGARYLAVKALAQFIKDHGTQLARSSAEPIDVAGEADPKISFFVRKATDGSRYLFVRSDDRTGPRSGDVHLKTKGDDATQISAHYDLGPFGAKVLYLPAGATDDGHGDWYPKAVAGPERPAQLPAEVKIDEVRRQADPGPTQWQPIKPGQGVEDLGIFDRRFVYYRATIPGGQNPSKTDPIAFIPTVKSQDGVNAYLNGQRLTAGNKKHGVYFELPSLTASNSQLIALYENGGRPNGGAGMEAPCGLQKFGFAPASHASEPLTEWRSKIVDGVENRPEVASDYDDSSWPRYMKISADDGTLKPEQIAVYRTSFDLSKDELQGGRSLLFGRIDEKGWIYVNGQLAGTSNDWETPQRFEVTKFLRPGKNVVAVVVQNIEGAGGLAQGVSLEPANMEQLPITWEASGDAAGVVGEWWKPEFDDSSWPSVKLDGSDDASATQGPLTWYRMKFELPAPQAGVWVPWKLHLDSAGNGFIYLNGHPLGRWWEIGPQRDYFLPECWLNTGAGKSNIVTLCLRPTGSASLRAASVQPYADQAEKR